MRQQCGADASGPPSSCEPGSPRSEALVLELPSLSRGQAHREKSLRSARVARAQLRLVATPPDDPRRGRAKIVNSISWGLRRSRVPQWVTAEQAQALFPAGHWLRVLIARAEVVRGLLPHALRQFYRQEGFEL